MSRNLLLAVGLLAALCLAAALVMFGGLDSTAEPQQGLTADEEPALEPSHAPAEALREVDDVPQESDLEVAEAPAREGREQAEIAQAAGTVSLQVQDEAGNALAHAQVWVLHSADDSARKTFGKLEEIDALMEERGALHETDASGALLLARNEGEQMLTMARKGELWGRRSLRAKDVESEYTLQLSRDATLRVQVLGPAGQPAVDVAVDLEQVHSYWSSSRKQRRTAAPDGIATFPHAQVLLSGAWRDDDVSMRAIVDALTEEPIAQELTPESLFGPLITLRLPATGSVTLEVLDESWEPFSGTGTATLEVIPEGESRVVSPFSGDRRRTIDAQVVAGKARFERVALGVEVGANVKRDKANVGTRAFGPGPLRAGEEAKLEVRLGSDHPVVRLRVLGAAGKPLAGTALDCELQFRSEFMNNQQRLMPVTDDRGFAIIDLEQDWIEGNSRILSVRPKVSKKPRPTGSLDLSRKLELGLNELGDLRLAPPAIFVSGRVVDGSGSPIAKAELALRSKGEESYGWDNHWNFNAKSDDAGNFQIMESIAGETFQLAAEKKLHAGTWADFTRGEENLVLVMQAEGQLAGNLLLDENISMEHVIVSVDGPAGIVEHLDYSHRSKSPSEDGEFLFGRLMPGTRGVTFRARNQADDLLSIEDVDVRAGELTRDPRLQDVDLRGKLFVHELRLIGSQPGERFQGSVSFGPAGSEDLHENAWFSENPLSLVTLTERIDAVITVNGYRPKKLFGHSGKADIELHSGIKVTLSLTGADLPAPPVFIKPTLVPLEGEAGSIDFSGDSFDERREVKASAMSSGRLKVQWIVERRSSSGSVATSFHPDREQVIDVLDVDSEQRFEISLTEEEMAEILKSLN